MACRYTYQGKTYEAAAFYEFLRAMPLEQASAFMPTVKAVPEAPFVGTTDAWVGLILKRMVRYAVDHGIERVAFITGDQSVQRYGLAKELTSVAWTRTPDGRYNVEGNTGYEPIVRKGLDMAALTKLLGAQTAARVEQGEGTYPNDPATPINGRVRGAFDTPGLTVGGYGMRVFYDTMLPRIARHVVRKLGGAGTRSVRVPIMVGMDKEANRLGMSIADMMDLADPQDYAADLVGFEINQAMRDASSNGLPLFSLATFQAVALPSPGGLASFMRTSRVKDATGEPIRFFHGTANAKGQAPFQIFKNVETDRFQMYLPPGQARGGFYFSPMRSLAQGYAREAALPDREPRILEVFLNITNPYLASEDEFGFYVTQTDIERLEAAGYDGVVKMAPWSEGRLEQAFQVVAFRPEQIKSATENNGQFDSANPDIRFSLAEAEPTPFQTWFGESEVVDEHGMPLVVFHGTTRDFSAFDPQMLGSSTDHATARLGFFFSSSPDVAALFAGERWEGWPLARGFQAGANVMPVFLSIANPASITAREFMERFVRGGEDAIEFQQDLYVKGHDGLRILADEALAQAMGGEEYSADTWVALRADQVKSAIGNAGPFERSNPDIRFSMAPAPPTMNAGGDGWLRDPQGAQLVAYAKQQDLIPSLRADASAAGTDRPRSRA
jgi:hypothetical protein